MLLLLKQTTERKDAEEVIFFGDENSYVNLGDFEEVIHGHDKDATLGMEFRCTLQESLEISIIRNPNSTNHSIQVLDRYNRFDFETYLRLEQRKLIIDSLCYRTPNCKMEKVLHEEIVFFNNQSIAKAIDYINGIGIPKSNSSVFGQVMQQLFNSFTELFKHVHYLGPTRVNPQRLYHWEGDHPEEIGRFGDKTIDALLSARVDRKTIQHDDGEVSIEERISQWLREMNLAHTFILERTEQQGGKDYDVRIQLKEDGPKIALSDMGYGLSQFLPVLVLCFYAPVGSTLILEQPGIHLHPKVQSQLADLLIEGVNDRNLQILVESHSEHLLTRLQLRIAEQKIAANQTALYFCENENGTSKIKSLEIDDLGNITNWPKDFFGNVRGDLKKMARQQIKRQKEAES